MIISTLPSLYIYNFQEKEGSPGWNALAKRNELDIRLYNYAEKLFKEQKEIIESYVESMAV